MDVDSEHLNPPGPNDLLPCPSESAKTRHRARAESCWTCGVGYEEPPVEVKVVVW